MKHRINLMAHRFVREDGYGRYGMHLIRALSRFGVDVYPALLEQSTMPGWMQRMGGLDYSRKTLLLMPANCFPALPGRVWGYTMIESSVPPKGWAKRINETCERLLVPCEHNALAFKEGGVCIPIHILHGGTDPEEFPILPLVEHDRPYTFVCLGDRGARKGVERVWSAFFKAFENMPDVRLIIKVRDGGLPGISNLSFSDKRISFWKEDLDSMTAVYDQADCFVFPSYAEGWGMPPREAAMMGLPVIATRYSGLEVGIDKWAIPLEKHTMQECSAGTSDMEIPGGMWAVPDLDELIEKMRWCYTSRLEARRKGLEAALWLRENQTWNHTAGQLTALLEAC